MPSYTYELPEQSVLLSNIRQNLVKVGQQWNEIASFMRDGHVQYTPIRNNPMRSGYKFVYQQAKLNLTLYFPEKIFNNMLEILDPEKVEILNLVFFLLFLGGDRFFFPYEVLENKPDRKLSFPVN